MEKKCPTCSYVIKDDKIYKCPRCSASLLEYLQCSGSCKKCNKLNNCKELTNEDK